MKINFEKIGKIMSWEIFDGETWEDVFKRKGYATNQLPNLIIVDIQYEGGIYDYLIKKEFSSEKDVRKEVMKIFRLTINEPIFYEKGKDTFPTLYNFFCYVQKLDRGGNLAVEARKIAELAWSSELMQKLLVKNTKEMFKKKPSKKEYEKAIEKIKKIYSFSDLTIEKIRYFVCQTRSENLNPSLNKNLWIWSKKMETGKTTVARAIAAVLNGKDEITAEFESNLQIEAQFSEHALPKGCYCNAVILDEAQPKDSAKSYGQVKTKITSNFITFNPKHNRLINIPVKRNYIWTSNDPLYEFIRDDSDRRFLEIHYDSDPKFLKFDEIYTIWKNFVLNCEPEDDFYSWGKSFGLAEGMGTKIKQEYFAKMTTSNEFLNELNYQTGYISIGFFYDKLEKGTASTDQRKHIREAVQLFAKEVQPSRYRVSDIKDAINNERIKHNLETVFFENAIEEKNENSNDYGLPF